MHLTMLAVASPTIRRRLFGSLLIALAVGSCALAGVASAASKAPRTVVVVASSQQLVSILHQHKAHIQPSNTSQAVALLKPNTTITDTRTFVPVLARSGAWIKVMLPGRPNGHTGWIVQANTASYSTPWSVVVVLSQRVVRVYRAGRLVRSFAAVVGQPTTPTPTGRFYVEEAVALPASNDAAPIALALSARSTFYKTFGGGPAQTAIHGLSNIGGTPGTAVSHGCVRLPSKAMYWLAKRIGSGTPVTIVP